MEDNPTRLAPDDSNHQSEDLSADERIQRAVDAGERERETAAQAEKNRKHLEELEAKRRETLPRCPHCGCSSNGQPGPVIFATVPVSIPPGIVALCIYCANPACQKAFNVIPMPRPQPPQVRPAGAANADKPPAVIPVAAMPNEVLRKK